MQLGVCCVLLDVRAGAQDLAGVVEAAQMKLLLTAGGRGDAGGLRALLPPGVRVVDLDDEWDDISKVLKGRGLRVQRGE